MNSRCDDSFYRCISPCRSRLCQLDPAQIWLPVRIYSLLRSPHNNSRLLRATFILGLLLFGIGCLMMWPAGLKRSFELFCGTPIYVHIDARSHSGHQLPILSLVADSPALKLQPILTWRVSTAYVSMAQRLTTL